MAIELPEAVILARQMQAILPGKIIACVDLSKDCDSLIRQGFINLHQVSLAGRVVETVISRGKWIFIHLSLDWVLLIALETGGKILFNPNREELPDKFHVRLEFADGSFLSERITGWGWARAFRDEEVAALRYPGKLGLSPLENDFTLQSFGEILDRSPKKNIKAVLLDQQQIAGIGTGYAQEILFKARIHPARKAGELLVDERSTLYSTTCTLLHEAVRLGGSEYDLYDRPGGFQKVFVKTKQGAACPVCGTPVEKISVQGSATYVCPCCQK